MSDDLKAQLEDAQAAYQKLYAQYQEELAFIARWQKRVKAENHALRARVAELEAS
ncbi:hypothetical protein ICV35_24930 [Rhodococcus ruber]|uniref:hypothetical protein n=1 Tax=Rhodococcus ruber TaxID=1830 RepID=UPI00177E56FA|nr:hypothetical protein [Rhodococcus ruber]MBD8056895.1 hypothetical protein [Rhodococcus ruber]